MSRDGGRPAARRAGDNLHRKNAAEWLMWVVLQPVRWWLLLRRR